MMKKLMNVKNVGAFAIEHASLLAVASTSNVSQSVTVSSLASSTRSRLAEIKSFSTTSSTTNATTTPPIAAALNIPIPSSPPTSSAASSSQATSQSPISAPSTSSCSSKIEKIVQGIAAQRASTTSSNIAGASNVSTRSGNRPVAESEKKEDKMLLSIIPRNVYVTGIRADASLIQTANFMTERDVSSLLVVSADKADDGMVKGIITERDISRKYVLDSMVSGPSTLYQADRLKSHPLYCIRPSMTIIEAMTLARRTGYRHFPVVDESVKDKSKLHISQVQYVVSGKSLLKQHLEDRLNDKGELDPTNNLQKRMREQDKLSVRTLLKFRLERVLNRERKQSNNPLNIGVLPSINPSDRSEFAFLNTFVGDRITVFDAIREMTLRDSASALILESMDGSNQIDASSVVQSSGNISGPGVVKCLGVFTERDFVRSVIAKGKDPKKTLVVDVMSPTYGHLNTSNTLIDFVKLMVEKRVELFPVVAKQGEHVLGMITAKDAIRAYTYQLEKPSAEFIVTASDSPVIPPLLNNIPKA